MGINTGRPTLFGVTLSQNGLSVILLDPSNESFASVPYNANITVVDMHTHTSVTLQAVVEFDKEPPKSLACLDERMETLFARSTKRDEVTAAQTVISLLMDKFNPEIASVGEGGVMTRFEVTEVEFIAFNQPVVNGCYLTAVEPDDSNYDFEARCFKEHDSTFVANLRLDCLPITTPTRRADGQSNPLRGHNHVEEYIRDLQTRNTLLEIYATDNAYMFGGWDGFIFIPKYTLSGPFQIAEAVALYRDGNWRVYSRSTIN